MTTDSSPPPDAVDHVLASELDATLDTGRLLEDARRLIATASVTGDESAAQHVVADVAARLGLEPVLHAEDLGTLRAAPDYPGEEVSRDRLTTVTVAAPGADAAAPRLCISGHVDVVPPGDRPWRSPPFTPRIHDGRLFGRGAADMKAALVAGLHATAAVSSVLRRPPGDVVLHSVGAEEDGGLGAFAAVRRDDAFAGCVIAEPTSGDIVCAAAGALTFHGRITGRSAHACARLDGVSALDRFLPVYRALQRLETELNADIAHSLMRDLRLPYPLSVGRVRAGDWPSTVPEELVFEGRVGVPLGMRPEEVRRRVEDAVRAADGGGVGEPAAVGWTGGQFAPVETDVAAPLVRRLLHEAAAVLGVRPAVAGVAYGSDMRHYCARGIPTVLFGPGEISQAHATDECVAVSALVDHARVIARVAATFGTR